LSGVSRRRAVWKWIADRVRDAAYALLVAVLWPIVTAAFRVTVRGRTNLRSHGVVVAPHRSYWDIPLLCVACGPFRRITFLARSSHLRNPVLAPLVWAFAAAIDRDAFGVRDFRRAMAAAARARLLGIFPEGTTRPGAQPKPGAIRFAEHLGYPLVPVNLVAHGPYPPARFLRIPVRLPRIEVRIGPPVTVDELAREMSADLRRSDRHRVLTQRLMERIHEA